MWTQFFSGLAGAIFAGIILVLTRHTDRREKRRIEFETEMKLRLDRIEDHVGGIERKMAGLEGTVFGLMARRTKRENDG